MMGRNLKVAILAGGVGNVMAGDTKVGPKPMVEIGGRPVLWHIMSHYAHFGFNEFVIAVGHRGNMIKEYLSHYHVNQHDVHIDVKTGSTRIHSGSADGDWKVDVIETGRTTETAGRLLRLAPYLGDDTFLFTFGDSVSDVDIPAVVAVHRDMSLAATITAVHPPPRFGELRLTNGHVGSFSEKPMEAGWINGGYMVMDPTVFEYIDGDHEPLSPGLFENLASAGQLAAYEHTGFWHGIDTLRDKSRLDSLWVEGNAPWEVWST